MGADHWRNQVIKGWELSGPLPASREEWGVGAGDGVVKTKMYGELLNWQKHPHAQRVAHSSSMGTEAPALRTLPGLDLYTSSSGCSFLYDKPVNIKNAFLGFPGGAVVGSLPANAGDTGSSPGLGRSHRPRSNWAREPQLLSLRVWSLCSATREATIVRGPHTAMKSGPRLPQLEKALAQKGRPNTAKNKLIN